MNKKGLIGKILLGIGIIILIILIIIGLTAYQGYRFYSIVMNEKASMEASTQKMKQYAASKDIVGSCSELLSIESSFNKIKKEAGFACLNPLIRISVPKLMASSSSSLNQNLPAETALSCENIDTIFGQAAMQIKPLKDICNNQTLVNQASTKSAKSDLPPLPPSP